MKLAVIIRKDLKMPVGKAIAQAVHSVRGIKYPEDSAVVTLQALDRPHLEHLIKEHKGHAVIDAGRTVFNEPTLTCAAFLCDDNEFEDLRLY